MNKTPNTPNTRKGVGCLTLAIAFIIAMHYGGWTWVLFFILFFT